MTKSAADCIVRVGADLAKLVIQVHAVDRDGRATVRRALTRDRFESWCRDNLPAGCIVAMEACSGSHHWARRLQLLGLRPLLLPAHQVTPFRVQGRGGKNDANDAAAICEASMRTTIHPVAVKTPEQQAVLAAHTFRQGYIAERTALVNRVRGALLEFGIVVPQGIEALRKALPELIDRADAGLPDPVRTLLRHALLHWIDLDLQIAHAEQPIRRHVRDDPQARALTQLHGIAEFGASALIATVGDFSQFSSPRQVSAWLGVVPSQNSSGGKSRLGRITKQGSPWLRSLLVTGARSAVQTAHKRSDPVSRWLTDLRERCGWQKACVALVNKNLRIAWAILTRGECYDADYRPAVPINKLPASSPA